MIPLGPAQWTAAVAAAFCIGVSKAGLPGISMVNVLLMVMVLPARESTGIVLPLLIFADLFAVGTYRSHARWRYILPPLGPAFAGIVLGAWLMPRIPAHSFAPVIGWIVLTMAVIQFVRRLRPNLFERLPHTPAFAGMMGALSGIATMLANAAGPIMSIYLLARRVPKYEMVGSAAIFFLIVNLVKVPFSTGLGLINPGTLMLNLCLLPAVVTGLFAGRATLRFVPQRLFEEAVLGFAAVAAAWMILK